MAKRSGRRSKSGGGRGASRQGDKSSSLTDKAPPSSDGAVVTAARVVLVVAAAAVLVMLRFATARNKDEKSADAGRSLGEVTTLSDPTGASMDSRFVVAGYMPEYRSYIDLNAAAAHLTDVILFSVAPNADGTLGGFLGGSHYLQARGAREHKEKRQKEVELKSDEVANETGDLRIMFSVGGAGRSDSFPSITSDANRRKKFVEEIISLCERELLDGVDFDWESPRSQSDLQAYSTLLEEASKSLHAAGLILSAALHPGQYLPAPAYEAVDRINLMTYDIVIQRTDGSNDYSHHAAIDSVLRAVDLLAQRGCPRSKIVLGIPAYARGIQNPGDVKTYSEIVDMMTEKGGGAPPTAEELEGTNQYWGYAFDAPADVRKKVDLAVEGGLGGIFFWEVGQDWYGGDAAPGGMLLKAAAARVATLRSSSQGTSLHDNSNEL